MNPISLLTKGRTFKDMGDRSGAYKILAKGGAVPKFGPCKQAGSRSIRPEPEAIQTSLFEPPVEPVKAIVIEPPQGVPEPVEPMQAAQPVIPPSSSPFSAYAKTVEKRSEQGVWKRITEGCVDMLRRMFLWPKSRPVQRPTVQAELALEKVTVLKNDLNEDDLEVVLVERKVGTGEKPLARLSKVEMTGEAWSRLTAPFRKKSSDSAVSPKAEPKPEPELSARVG